jgi:hypothetical protein
MENWCEEEIFPEKDVLKYWKMNILFEKIRGKNSKVMNQRLLNGHFLEQ